jgi:hypothetical protein
MMVQQSRHAADTQRGELEIIPPGADWPSRPGDRVSNSAGQFTFVRIARLGPAGIILFSLVLGMLAGLAIVLLLGRAVIGVAIAGFVIIGAAVSFSCAQHFALARRHMTTRGAALVRRNPALRFGQLRSDLLFCAANDRRWE